MPGYKRNYTTAKISRIVQNRNMSTTYHTSKKTNTAFEDKTRWSEQDRIQLRTKMDSSSSLILASFSSISSVNVCSEIVYSVPDRASTNSKYRNTDEMHDFSPFRSTPSVRRLRAPPTFPIPSTNAIEP